jgi:hypothetical protein
MMGKIIPFETGYRLKVKYWFMFWYIDPGYPTFNSLEEAKRVAYDAGIRIKESSSKLSTPSKRCQ